jgi:hypothetical protein
MLMMLIRLDENINLEKGNSEILLQTSKVIGIHKTIDESKYLRMSQSQNEDITHFTQWIRFLCEWHVINHSEIPHFYVTRFFIPC